VCEFLRDAPEFSYDMLLALTVGNEHLDYHLLSMSDRRRLRLAVPVALSPSTDQPHELDSLAFVWPAANWAERATRAAREITYRGHPDPRPLFVQEDNAAEICRGMADGTILASGSPYPASIDGLFLRLELEGERLVDVQPQLGYRRAGLERKLTDWPYPRGTLLSARMDGFSAMQCDLAYAMAIEKLLGVEPPRRAQQLRVVYGELQRMASHLFWLARSTQHLFGLTLVAPSYAWEARNAILGFFQLLGGNPVTPDLIAIGGLKQDLPEGFPSELSALVDQVEGWLDDIAHILSRDGAIRTRLEGAGVIDPGTALGLGITGPCLRAAGMGYDVRDAFPYAAYSELDVQVPVEKGGDAYARHRVRVAELRASAALIRQVIPDLYEGPANAFKLDAATTPSAFPPLPSGTAYVSVEGPRGELGVYLESDDSHYLSQAHIRGPSFSNLSALPLVGRGLTRAQLVPVLDSLDISMGEVER
jgi:NADH:ubiquinone oxidoreductase subunit D